MSSSNYLLGKNVLNCRFIWDFWTVFSSRSVVWNQNYGFLKFQFSILSFVDVARFVVTMFLKSFKSFFINMRKISFEFSCQLPKPSNLSRLVSLTESIWPKNGWNMTKKRSYRQTWLMEVDRKITPTYMNGWTWPKYPWKWPKF